jgi:lipopolysaccharide export system protein LptA
LPRKNLRSFQMFTQRFFKSSPAILLGVGFWLLTTSGGWAEPPAPALTITSKTMVASNLDRVIIFEGDVVLKKGEFSLTADRLEVTLAPRDQGKDSSQGNTLFGETEMGKEAISLMEAMGHVEVSQGNRHGKAESAIYDQKDEKVILTGRPEIWEKDYRVSGRKMIFYLREQRNVVEDSNAIVYPK